MFLHIYKRSLLNISRSYSSYQNSPLVENVKITPKYEVTKNPDDWKHVERLLPSLIIPIPKEKATYASGWKPQSSDDVSSSKYFVPRNKNFMVPVYLSTSHRGMKKLTKIRKVQGDIFQLENDIKKHLEKVTGRSVATLANELVGYIHVKGDHVNIVRNYLVEKGF